MPSGHWVNSQDLEELKKELKAVEKITEIISGFHNRETQIRILVFVDDFLKSHSLEPKLPSNDFKKIIEGALSKVKIKKKGDNE